MPSHFSTIGLPIQSQEEMFDLAVRMIENSYTIEVSEGSYLRWTSGSGAEIWLQVNNENSLVGMTPHFAGQSSLRVGIVERVIRPNSSPLDGAFHGWAAPSGDDPQEGHYPFVFDAPDFRRHSALQVPTIVQAQVAAFAHEINVYESEDAYNASQTGEVKFGSKSFIPSGLFTPHDGTTQPPEAYAIFTGHIVQAETKRNELTGARFYWALVDTYGGAYDVVIDPELVESEPQVGGILYGSFWLSGRILP
jgi:hypothetical protein